jgi:NADH:ubiquinone oxidoreductase subunit E
MRRLQVLLCSGSACQSAGALELKRALVEAIADLGLTEEIQICGNRVHGALRAWPHSPRLP